MKVAVNDKQALAPGRVIKQFAVLECLGIDQHTALYRAESVDTEHPVLLIEYLPAGLVQGRAGTVVPTHREAAKVQRALTSYATRLREVALVGHPALPVLDDIWLDQGALYAVGPWQPGRSLLAELSSRKSPPDEDTLRQWARTLCDALSALHRHHLVHGNLTVHMLRLRHTGELMLPLIAGDVVSDDAPPWLAPEQHPLNRKPAPVGPWSDIYQLSAVMYQLMTGAAPPTVLQRWEGAPLELVSGGGQSGLSAGLVAATRKGLAMHHDARPQSIEAWLDIAGLPDRRSQGRYEPGPAPLQPLRTERSPRTSNHAGAMGMSSRVSSYDLASGPEEVVDETPLWVWFCLAVAVAAFISILVRAI